MNILGRLPEEKTGNQLEIDLTDRYSKPTKAAPVTAVALTSAAIDFVNSRAFPYETQAYSLTGHGLQLLSNLFAAVNSTSGR